MYKYIILFYLLFMISCRGKKENNSISNKITDRQFTAPAQATRLAYLPDSLKPKTVALDTAPKPLKVTVPSHKGGSYIFTPLFESPRKINLAPPVGKLLPVLKNLKGETVRDSAGNAILMGDGGIADITNFTTDNGLIQDAVTCSIMDKTGNLWFGTLGGGVSRYDGESFTNFSTANGLANNSVFSMIEDRAGNLWFGTLGGGVSRFDGKSFTTFSTEQGLANNRVMCIAEDKKNNLWFGTEGGGVSRYVPSASGVPDANSFTTFSTPQGLAGNVVLCIHEDKTGKIWFGTSGSGLSRYDPEASPRTGSKCFTTYSTADGLPNNIVWNITEDKRERLWFGTFGGGVGCYDPYVLYGKGLKCITTFSVARNPGTNIVKAITEDGNGNLWFGTEGSGVSRYDRKSFTTFSPAQGLSNDIAWSITEDKKENLWFGTGSSGVSRYNGKAFTTFSTAQGLANNVVWSIARDKKGNLWFGTFGGGISRYDGKSFKTFAAAQGLPVSDVRSITEDKAGNLWFGTYGGGVSRYDGTSFTTFAYPQGLASNGRVFCITEDRTGNLWFGTKGSGVSRFDGKSFTTFTTAQGLANNDVRGIVEDTSGNLWLATNGGGVSLFDGVSFTTITTHQGLANNIVWSMTKDRNGNFWFGTSEGLSVLSAGDAMKLAARPGKGAMSAIANNSEHNEGFIKTFTKKDGLPDNVITQVLQLPNGKMAIGTNLGITLFKPSDDLTMLNDINIYNTLTGCPVKDITSMYADSSGVIWAGTGSEKTALVRFDPSALTINNDPPTLIIKSIKVNGENVCWYDLKSARTKRRNVGITNEVGNVSEDYINEEVGTLGKTLTETERDEMRQHFEGITFDSISPYYPLPQHLVIPFRLNNITIDFNAIETGKPNLVNYRYILEGYDKGWSPVMKNKSATFGNIADGTYIFKVKAQAPNGLWCLPVTYMFKVLPPWYRTWWFLFLEAITVISLVLWAIKLYTARKLAQQKREIENLLAISNERARIASDMHDDLGAGLTAIGLLSGLANLKINLDHPAKTEIEKIEKSAGNLAENLREIIWTMNTRFDKLDDFIVYVRAFSVEYFEESDMNFKFESPSQLPDIGMQGDLRRNLFLCIKEALHNIIKHSKASNARLSFTIDTSDGNSSQFTLVIEIKDDGIGIAGTNINKFGNGLKNMNERITKFGGRLDIDVNNGTRLLFRVIIK